MPIEQNTSHPEPPRLLFLARTYRDTPARLSESEYQDLREAGLVSADGDLNVAGTELEPYLDEFPV